MSILNYLNFYNLIYNSNNNIQEEENFTVVKPECKKYLINIDDLKKVNLQPPKDIIPGPSRNMPPLFDKVDLRNLNKAQLNCILKVKLKKTRPNEKIKYYEPRHPVLSELHTKFKIKERYILSV